MRSTLITLALLLLTVASYATTVTLNANGSGHSTTTTKTSGDMRVENGVDRGYAVWNLASSGIPSGSTITTVKVIFTQTVTGTGTPTCTIYGYNGDISSLSAASLYSGAVTANSLYTGTWGTTGATKTLTLNATSISFVQSALSGTISLTWVLSGGSRIYNMSSGSIQLQVIYTCTTPTATASCSPATVCSGSSMTLSGASTGGSTYSWAGPNSFSSTAQNPAGFTATTAASGVYTFTATSLCGVTTTSTVSVTVKSAPAAITGNSYVCLAGTTTLSNTSANGTWTASSSRATVNSSTGVVTGVTAGAVNISYSTGCGSSVVLAMSVKGTPAAITGTTNVCTGSTTTLSNTTTGGTWSSSNTGVATIDSSTGVVTGVSTGSTTITYSNFGCAYVTTTVNDYVPAGTITGGSGVCTGSTLTLSNSASGGTWSSSNNAIATVNSSTGVVTGVGAGSLTITYASGCGTNATQSITVTATPNAISGSTTVCNGATTTLSSTTAGGTWSSSNNSLATVTSGGVVSGVSLGSLTISYTKSGCSALKAMSVNTTAGSITGTTSFCASSTTTLSNSSAGGSWSSSNTSIASVNSSTGVVSGVAAGSATITYSTGCGSVATQGVTVLNAPAAAITGTTTYCEGNLSTLSNATGGGIWTSSNTSIATINAASGLSRGMSGGSATITYTLSGGCYSTTGVTITPIPASITGTNNICLPGTSTLSNAAAGGTWSSSNTAVATINATTGAVTTLTTGSTTIAYTTGCGSDAATATVNVVTTPPSITGTSSICSGNTSALANAVAGGTWSSSNTALATVNASGVVTGVDEGSPTISYTLINACGTNAATFPMTISLTGKWLGVNTDWNDARNWPCSTVPDATTNVYIPSGTTNLPGFSGATFSMNGLRIANGVTITVASDATLSVKGTLNNNGTISGSGSVEMTGTSAQTMSGVGTMTNLTINNSNGVSINSTDTVKLTGVLTMTSGNFNANSGLVLVSNASGSARVAAINGGTISGNVHVQQYLPGGRRAYRFFGHPFSGSIALNQLMGGLDITGVGGSNNGFTTTGSNAPSCFFYNTSIGNSTLSSDPGWTAYTNANANTSANEFKRYQGIRLFVRGAKSEGLGYATGYTPSATTVSMYGVLNQGTQTITLTKGTNSDYNQISNPFASPVNIGAAIATAYGSSQVAGSAFYVWNPYIGTAGNFQAVPISGGNYVIAANTSFQVRAASHGATLAINESHKATTPNTQLLKSVNDMLTLNIYDANYHLFDMLYINFNQNAGAENDNRLDATKVINADMNFYTLSSDNSKLSIDARPYVNGSSIALGINSNYAQEFIIRAENLAIPTGAVVYLVDNYLHTTTLLAAGTEYRFSVTKDAASQGTDRFALKMGEATTTATATNNTISVNIAPNPATDNINVSFANATEGGMSINIVNLAGETVATHNINNTANGNVSINISALPAGIYMATVINGGSKNVVRIVKQ
ncbi:MAG: T9SS C-terminal target domain-containing protein [Chitinophagia bacterium]|nr:T9SS C-terminal target domain-containing protein [Chitinophagia bacterium]